MKKQKTAYELSRSQVDTPLVVVDLFWKITNGYRTQIQRVIDLGAGDGRFAIGGRYQSYKGIEIDRSRSCLKTLPQNSQIIYQCAFKNPEKGFDACVGNPPYVRHHDLDETWRDKIADDLSLETGENLNRKCNLYVYFLFLSLLKTKENGLVSTIVPYEWVARPSAAPLRSYIKANSWHVDIYRFKYHIFDGVLTTASISVIDKSNKDANWQYFEIHNDGTIRPKKQVTGSRSSLLGYEKRGDVWAMRGMSPGSQKIFTLSEGERIHAGLRRQDVLPCVTSLRHVPGDLSRLTAATFRKHFVNSGEKCWLIKSFSGHISRRVKAYLDQIPEPLRDTWTCHSRVPWYQYDLADSPSLLVSSGFTKFGPKILINTVKARAVGAVCGVHSSQNPGWLDLSDYLKGINFETRVVSHAKVLKKIEIRQLNAVLNVFSDKKKKP